LFAVNKDILNFVGRLFTIFTAYIVSVFLACFYNGCDCDRFPTWSCLECYI